LSNGERRRKVGYAGVATFNGVPGIPRNHEHMFVLIGIADLGFWET